MIGSFEIVKRELDLPYDAFLLARQANHMVIGSLSAQLVFRISRTEDLGRSDDPSNVRVSHLRAWDMHKHGLNVLAPVSPEPEVRGEYTISTTELAEQLLTTGWKPGENRAFGTELSRWESYRPSDLERLDVEVYSRQRVERAAKSDDPTLKAAADWCHSHLIRLQSEYPFRQLVDAGPGCIHGDPHLGNLVRSPEREVPLFIDLDTVKLGPAAYDVAIMLVYERRFSSQFPASQILEGYQAEVGLKNLEDMLNGLQLWKEASSFTQLLTRWSTSGIKKEFFKRIESSFFDLWTNVIGTPVVN